MLLNHLQLQNYRNYEVLSIELSPSIQVFFGKNAQGKTNILESIYFSSIGRSHRTQSDNDLIAWTHNHSKIDLYVENLSVPKHLQFILIRGQTTRSFSNAIPIRRSELIGRFKTVLFSPEDLFLIKGNPATRRRFLDIELSQSSPRYYKDLIDYKKILSNRNSILKQIREDPTKKNSKDLLEIINQQFIEVANRITQKRIDAVKKFSMLAMQFQQQISNEQENLSISYEIFNHAEDLQTWINSNIDREIFHGKTEVGPHRDDLTFLINDVDAKLFCSQGQQRTIALSVKLAELEFLKDNDYPILLLDDVMSELDSNRREKLIDFLNTKKIQTLITATDATIFPRNSISKLFEVNSGKII